MRAHNQERQLNMFHFQRMRRERWRLSSVRLLLCFCTTLVIATFWLIGVAAQNPAAPHVNAAESRKIETAIIPALKTSDPTVKTSDPTESAIAAYVDRAQGLSSIDLVQRALASNAQLAAVRMDIDRGRGRLRQAGLLPNPTVDFEQVTGRLTGSAGERSTTVGFSLPIELGGKRKRRIELAQAELEAAEAEVADRERRLILDVRVAYIQALAALRELEITAEINSLDSQTARFVEARVSEGDAAPLEFNVLRVEVDRLRSRRAMIEGRLQAALLLLKNQAGIPDGQVLRLSEDLDAPVLRNPPDSLEAAPEIALRSRPDLRLARLNEEAAQAGLRLARAQATPDVTAFSRYSVGLSSFDQTPVGAISDKDRLLSFGVIVSLPIFNHNQGAKAEAAAAITQAERQRQFTESLVRAEVASAYARYQAATQTLKTFEEGVINRSNENIRVLRASYQIGAFRITDLINEQRRLMDSQREYTETLAERYRALADLQAALGVNQ